MKYNPEEHHRKSIRLKECDYGQVGGYFVTICTHERQCVFGEVVDGHMRLNEIGRIVEEEWRKTAEIRGNVELDVFVIMPNHSHGILIITDSAVGATRRVAPRTLRPNTLGSIIGQFKSRERCESVILG